MKNDATGSTDGGGAATTRTPTKVRLTEIYTSVQGESTWAGLPCVFVRLTGCPLRCVWCDTVYAFTEGDTTPIEEVVARASAQRSDLCEVTGGEPLAQAGCIPLLKSLADAFDTVLLETSGAYSIRDVDPRVRVILDLKAPGSGEESRNDWSNISLLESKDEVKIVVANRADFDWAVEKIREHELEGRVPLLISPVHGEVDPKDLNDWLLESGIRARLQLQLHKYIWDPNERSV